MRHKIIDPERLTEQGIGLLRLASGLFFLIPGLVNALQPQDFLVLVERLPVMQQASWLHPLVTAVQIICGLMLVVGWQTRLTPIPLAIITILIGYLAVINDTTSTLQALSLYAFIATVGIYTSLVFLGSGAWAIQAAKPILGLTSGAARNFGVLVLRVALAFFFITVAVIGWSDAVYRSVLPAAATLYHLTMLLCLLGGLSVLTGFKVNSMGWLLASLTVLHFIFIGWAEAWASQIGLIYVLLHGLVLAAIISLRIIRFGSDLAVEHILSRDKKTVVVLGSGFAATSLAKRLERRLPADWQLVIISEQNYLTFNPMLAEIVSGAVMPAHVIASIRQMLRKTRFINGQVTAVDTTKRLLTYKNDVGSATISYHHLVFALGSRANLNIVPGMAQHALPFKLLGDALALRNRIIERLEAAEQEPDPARRAWLGHFVVIGGGFSGVEVAGAIQDFIHASRRYYPRLRLTDLKVSLVHNSALPIPELGRESLGRHTLMAMQKAGIMMQMNSGVTAVDANGVILADSTRLDGGTIICSIGTKPNPLLKTLTALPQDRGRLKVNPDMSVIGAENIWAIGDCAVVPNAHDGKTAPPTAQFAIREGQQLADNIKRVIHGRASQPFSYQSKGSMAAIGHLNGVADLGFIQISGFAAWLLWRAFYLSLMPTMAKKCKIFFEWNWSMLFSPDTVNLRFTTSATIDNEMTTPSEQAA